MLRFDVQGLFTERMSKEAVLLKPGEHTDGTHCMGTAHGLLQRATINAKNLVPVGKETDRRWEQGDDPSMIDSEIYTYEKLTTMVVAEASQRKKLAAIGVRPLTGESKLSQTPVSNAIKGKTHPSSDARHSQTSRNKNTA
jgi:hypothetical protein